MIKMFSSNVRKANINVLIHMPLKSDMKYSLKLIRSGFIPAFNSSNSVSQHFGRYYCKISSNQTNCQINKLKHKLLFVDSLSQLTNYRFLWGKRVKKPGEIAPGIKTKDVTLAGKLFKEIPDQHKQHFLAVVDNFPQHKYIKRHGFVEFITAALPFMKEFGVHKDLDSYKALMNVFPKDRYRPENIFQVGFSYYPLEQRAACEILCAMEANGVMPDKEMESLIITIFSKYSAAWRKCARMTYWMTKLCNANPFPLPDELPLDSLELATLAIKRMCIDIQTKISVYSTAQVEDAIDKTWIVSGQSPSQQEIISELADNENIYVEGPFKVWLRHLSIGYFLLRANNPNKVIDDYEEDDEINDVSDIPLSTFGKTDKTRTLSPTKNLHIQEDGKILAVCATGTSSRDSLLSWIRILQASNPKLDKLAVMFTLRGMATELQNIDDKDCKTSFSYEHNNDANDAQNSESTKC